MSNNQKQPAKEQTEAVRRPRHIWLRRILTWSLVVAILFGLRWFLVDETLWRADVALEHRKTGKALTWLKWHRFLDSDHPRGHFLMGRALRRMGEYEESLKHLQKALDLHYSAEELRREQNLLWIETGKEDQVGDGWSTLFLNAGSDGPEISKGYVRMSLKKLAIANSVAVLDAWKKDFPDDAEPYVMYGQLHECFMNWRQAAEMYEEALQRSPMHSDALIGLGRVRMELKNYKEAEEVLQIAHSIGAGNKKLPYLLAECVLNLGRTEKAKTILDEQLQQGGNAGFIHKLLGSIALDNSDIPQALSHLEQAVKLRPSDAELRVDYAKALKLSGRNEEAKTENDFVKESNIPLIKLAKLTPKLIRDPNNVELRYEIAEITWKYKSRTDGAKWFRSLLQIDPGHLKTHQALVKHHEWTREEDKAAVHRKFLQE